MPAAYDTYDYPSYWKGRDYEHYSEVIALKGFLENIPNIEKILDIGAGYGRLTPTYIHRAKKIILSDPSSKNLSEARGRLSDNKIQYIQSRIENLKGKLKPRSIDLILLIRVLHHLEDIDETLNMVNRLLDTGGYFILEFANKGHIKSLITEFLKGNITFKHDIFTRDIRSKKSIKKNVLPFYNYHPDFITEKLEEHGFEIKERRSVSNIRVPIIKKFISLETLLSIEASLQKPLSYLNFGPSIFVLSEKRG